MTDNWPIPMGATLRRREVHAMVGGQRQQGISTPSGSRSILIFTDPERGKKYGYDRHEGLRPDGLYAYTGEGVRGDQEFLRGNKAILSSARDERLIRLFTVRGVMVTYIGAFTPADPPFEYQPIPDIDGNERNGIIFLLAPVSADVSILPTSGSTEVHQVVVADWVQPRHVSFTVELQPHEIEISRIEFELQASFGRHLQAKKHEVRTLTLPAGSSRIQPDLYDKTAGEVIEAKKSTARSYVRMAIGQSLDYANNARRIGIEARPAILLPGHPEQDLRDLCQRLNVRMHTQVEDGFITSEW